MNVPEVVIDGDEGDHEKPFFDEKSDIKSDSEQTENINSNEPNNRVLVSNNRNSVKKPEPHKNPGNGEDEAAPAVLVTVPPDGGWGWVVMIASFFANFVVDGILYCYGDFIPVLKEEFGETAAKVSIPGSLLAGFYLMTGPFVSILTTKFGFQKITIIGAIFGTGAIALSSLAINIEFLIFSYGILGGIGFGMIYAPSIVIVGYYFERWRGIATGIAVCGSGIGTFAISPLNNFLLAKLGWKNSFLVQASFVLICIICGAMFRPIKPVKVAINESAEDYDEETSNELVKARKSHPRHSHISLKSQKFPTAAEILQISPVDENPDTENMASPRFSKSSQSLNVHNFHARFSSDVEQASDKRHSVPNIVDHVRRKSHHKARQQRSNSHAVDGSKRKSIASELNYNLSHGQIVEWVISSRRGTITQVDDKVNVQRDDAFFAGSLLRLPQYKSEVRGKFFPSELGAKAQLYAPLTRIPPKKEKSSAFSLKAIFAAIIDLFDFSLLKSPSFDLLLVSGFLLMIGYFTPFSYIKDRAIEDGDWDSSDTAWLLSTIGITNTIGRVLSGLISGFPGVNATLMHNMALVIAGVATTMSGLDLSVPYQYAYCAVFGFSMAAFASLRSIIVVELLGLENLNTAFGILLFVQGFGSALGSPLAGVVREATSSYTASFYFSGILITISGLMLFPMMAVNRWEKRKWSESKAKKSNI